MAVEAVGAQTGWRQRLALAAFHCMARRALRDFERRLTRAADVNTATLRDVLRRNSGTVFGRAHRLDEAQGSADIGAAFAHRVPLSTYHDYEHYVARIAAGETQILTADPVHMLAGSSGTTAQPKRIPRTRRAQRHHLKLVVLAEQAVIDRDIVGARRSDRGINLMSVHAAPVPEGSAVPIMAGPNAGMARLKRLIPLLWCTPAPVYALSDAATALYLHALFALQYPAALYIETPFAPQITGWLALIERHQAALIRDIRDGTLSPDLVLTVDERAAVGALLSPNPHRAAILATEFAVGFEGIIPRLWPAMRYLRTVTSGSFGVSLPRLRWLAGPHLRIHSGCHSASEGIIGINLKADGTNDYVLAIGTAYFEFIPLAAVDHTQPAAVGLEELHVGAEYELVLTSVAGLYRYRLGDIIRITGHVGRAPTFEYRYRRGTLLNLVGEKTSEFHTERALTTVLERWLHRRGAVKEYTVAGHLRDGRGHYTFYVELTDPVVPLVPDIDLVTCLDAALGDCNPYYRSSGRSADRLDAPTLNFVRAGTFDALLALQLRRAAPATASQVKVPRLVTSAEQLALLDEHVVILDREITGDRVGEDLIS